MKTIYMKQTFDILDPETVKELVQIGKVKQTEAGVKYLVVESGEKQVFLVKNGCKQQFFMKNSY